VVFNFYHRMLSFNLLHPLCGICLLLFLILHSFFFLSEQSQMKINCWRLIESLFHSSSLLYIQPLPFSCCVIVHLLLQLFFLQTDISKRLKNKIDFSKSNYVWWLVFLFCHISINYLNLSFLPHGWFYLFIQITSFFDPLVACRNMLNCHWRSVVAWP
jgi:hypothetical protein